MLYPERWPRALPAKQQFTVVIPIAGHGTHRMYSPERWPPALPANNHLKGEAEASPMFFYGEIRRREKVRTTKKHRIAVLFLINGFFGRTCAPSYNPEDHFVAQLPVARHFR